MAIRRIIAAIRRPSSRFSLGTLVAAGLVVGGTGVPTFNYVLSATSTDEFCGVCHGSDVSLEVVGTVHHDNGRGFHATCADCHLPREYVPYVMKKATTGANDVFHTILGTIDTPEKFEAHRMNMATSVWAEMNEDDSKNCRYCHLEERWDLEAQTAKARDFHTNALHKGKTCIDCHKGLAHKLPEGIEEDHQLEGIDL